MNRPAGHGKNHLPTRIPVVAQCFSLRSLVFQRGLKRRATFQVPGWSTDAASRIVVPRFSRHWFDMRQLEMCRMSAD